jgi:hypothetical protein
MRFLAMANAMVIDTIESTIRNNPGLTARQIKMLLYGDKGYGELAHRWCRELLRLGRIERSGTGHPGDPFKYYPM